MTKEVCVDCGLTLPDGAQPGDRCAICKQLQTLRNWQAKEGKPSQEALPLGKAQAQEVKVKLAKLQPIAQPDPNLPDELKKLVPSKDIFDRYVTRELVRGLTDIDVVVKGLLTNRNILLLGDAGGGKNHLGEACAYFLQRPIFWVNMNGGTTVEDIVGQMTLVPSPNGGVVTKWEDGILPLLMRFGGIFGADEVNAMPAEIGFVFQQVADWRRRLTLVQAGRQVIQAHKNFGIIATMNPDYRGTKPLNEAFRERFGVTLMLDYDKGVESKLISNPNLLKLADALRKSFHKTEISSPTSTRLLLDFEQNIQDYGEPLARKFFINRFDTLDQSAVAEAMKLHLDAPNKTTTVKGAPAHTKSQTEARNNPGTILDANDGKQYTWNTTRQGWDVVSG